VTEGSAASLRALVRGRVQGVGFRYFVLEHAAALSLTGFVRNLSDGRTVEVIAEGPPDRLEMLVKFLERGAPLSYVERVDTTWSEPSSSYRGFSIK
jgi:acylphosphatase